MGGTKSSSKYSHFEYSISMFLKAKLNQLGFAQESAQQLKRMCLNQDSTVIQLHREMVIKPYQTNHI